MFDEGFTFVERSVCGCSITFRLPRRLTYKRPVSYRIQQKRTTFVDQSVDV